MVVKKIVNGKLIDIGNYWDLFNEAYRDLSRLYSIGGNSLTFVLKDGLVGNIRDICSEYSNIYSKIPFPLSALESDLKYAFIGLLLASKLKLKDSIYVNNGLCICVDDGIYIKFKATNWSITDEEPVASTKLGSMLIYEDEIGYSQFLWLYLRLKDNGDISDYYTACFSEIADACNNNNLIIEWELRNILNIHRVPNRMRLIDRCVLDAYNNNVYRVDVLNTGVKIIGDNGGGIDNADYIDNEEDTVNNYSVIHDISVSNTELKGEHGHIIYANYVSIDNKRFNAIKNIADELGITEIGVGITGLLVINRLIVEVCGNLYDIDIDSGTYKLLATGVKLLGLDVRRTDRVYFKEIECLSNGVIRESIYYYNTEDCVLCDIAYKNLLDCD